MPGLFSRINKARDARQKKKHGINDLSESLPTRPRWDDAYTRSSVEPDEIDELIQYCTLEIKSRGLNHPFLLLPFRPTSNPSGVRTFIRHFFGKDEPIRGEALQQEVRLAEPMVLASVLKWCWSRLQGGVVSWDAYQLFKVGELDSKLARDSFKTFIPISVENDARQHIIFNFFELVAAIAAHGKTNGLSGVKLSRMAAWWAFEQKDTGDGFSGGYSAWRRAADATTHMFFAYLRSLSPEHGLTGITTLPRSLQKLLNETEYPPKASNMLVSRTNKLIMIVDMVSPTPFALLSRASKFEYRDSDLALRKLAEFEDATQALTDECRRVLKAISAANQSQASSSKHSTSLRDASWSRFEDIGFASTLNEEDDYEESAVPHKRSAQFGHSKSMMNVSSSSTTHDARPTTPSWADFLSTGFVDDPAKKNTLVPPDKVLPPIDVEQRQQSSQSHQPRLESVRDLDPGELASITSFELDDAFWWVWMSSLAPEETNERKAAFGRCAVIETTAQRNQWLVLEEIIAGAAPDPQEGAYIAEKKGFFSWTKRGRTLSRHKSVNKMSSKKGEAASNGATATTAISLNAHAKVAAKAAQLRAMNEAQNQPLAAPRGGRSDAEVLDEKSSSVLNLQSHIAGEATSALKWVKKYDKGAVADGSMSNSTAGRGLPLPPTPAEQSNDYSQPINSPSSSRYSLHPLSTTTDQAETTWSSAAGADELKTEDLLPIEPVTKDVADSAVEESKEAQTEPESSSPPPPPPPPKNEEPSGTPIPAPPAVGKAGGKQPFTSLKEAKESRGFRKLFRKNRSSKILDNSAGQLNNILQQDGAAAAAAAAATASKSGAASTDMSTTIGAKAPSAAEEEEVEPVANSAAAAEPTLEVDNLQPTIQEPAGDIGGSPDSTGSTAARAEFSRFDQGPLTDQPEFVPEDDVEDVAPAPMTRNVETLEAKGSTAGLTRSASPGVQDRWAQIRKNAANRAAQRQDGERERTMPAGKMTEGEDNTSGEETIESRVARIKARVAELTGNMEGSSAPPLRQPSVPSN